MHLLLFLETHLSNVIECRFFFENFHSFFLKKLALNVPRDVNPTQHRMVSKVATLSCLSQCNEEDMCLYCLSACKPF